ncbi:MAG: 4-hydroxy-tetrahydrodipicolinate synthase [Rhodospirillales bacterium]|nr:4-hydroxy-tetrahydrodipicolinate synthase [Rhodospirillales bacterium]
MFKGSFVALITPFRNGKVDEKAFQGLVEWQIAEGTHGLVPCGTTGESPTLSHDEHKRVVELCVEAAGKKVPVVAGTGSNSTAEAVELTRHAKKAGADGALVVTPYYNKPTQAGLYAHYKAIAEAVDLPILVYNIPPRCVIDISVETMARIAKLPNIVGVKEATGDVTRFTKHRNAIGAKFVQMSGDDGLALGHMAHGGHGCISVTANIAPRQLSEFQNACLASDFGKARTIHDRLAPLHEALFIEASPGPVKYAASLLGKCQPDTRLPLVEISEATKQRVRETMASAGLLN